jgi:hypothetical protein
MSSGVGPTLDTTDLVFLFDPKSSLSYSGSIYYDWLAPTEETGSVTGSVTLSSDSGSLNYNSSMEHIAFDFRTDFDLSDTDFTLMAWVRPTVFVGPGLVIGFKYFNEDGLPLGQGH